MVEDDETPESLEAHPEIVPARRKGRPKGPGRKRRVISDAKKAEILTLKARGYPNAVVAREAGVEASSVTRLLAQYSGLMQELENVERFRDGKADLLDAAQLRVLKSLVDASKLDKASLNQVAYAMDVLYKSNRLERNQSTANVSTRHQFTTTVGDDDDDR